MSEDIAAAALADRNLILRRAPEDAFQIGPSGRKFRQHNPAVPGIVRNERKNIEVGIVGAPIVHEFNCRANAVDVTPDRFGGPRRARGRDV